jgi:hypothetical protein
MQKHFNSTVAGYCFSQMDLPKQMSDTATINGNMSGQFVVDSKYSRRRTVN